MRGCKETSFNRWAPMLLSAGKSTFCKDGWIFEPKLDGMRAITVAHSGRCAIYSRSGLDYVRHFPGLAAELSKYDDVVFDGEIVAFGDEGSVDFERLLERIHAGTAEYSAQHADYANPVQYYIFDVLRAGGDELISLPLRDRKQILHQIVTQSQTIKSTFFVQTDGIAMLRAAEQLDLEGIVAKDLASRYRPGQRSKQWIKIKRQLTADVVICGYKENDGMLVGQFVGDTLQYRGTVRFGLGASVHQHLHSTAMVRNRCPFEGKHPSGTLWFEPKIIAEVVHHGETSSGVLRNPVFKRFRADLSIAACHATVN